MLFSRSSVVFLARGPHVLGALAFGPSFRPTKGEPGKKMAASWGQPYPATSFHRDPSPPCLVFLLRANSLLPMAPHSSHHSNQPTTTTTTTTTTTSGQDRDSCVRGHRQQDCCGCLADSPRMQHQQPQYYCCRLRLHPWKHHPQRPPRPSLTM